MHNIFFPLIELTHGRVNSASCEPRHEKTCLREFAARKDISRPAQLQRLARLEYWNFEKKKKKKKTSICIILSKERTTKALIRLHKRRLICAFVNRIWRKAGFLRCGSRYHVTLFARLIKHSILECALHISVISENRKSISKLFYGKITFQKCNPPDFKFYPSKLTNKFFPMWCNVKFYLLFVLFNAVKTDSKLALHHLGIFFIII